MKWGQRIDHRDASKPGWREDPDRPGVDRYWTGNEWDDTIPPRATQDSTVIAVAFGLVLAAALFFAIYLALN